MALDLFNKKLTEEIKNIFESNYMIDRGSINNYLRDVVKRLKKIKDPNIKSYIYNELGFINSFDGLLETLDKFVDLYKSNKEICLYCLSNNMHILKYIDTIRLFEEDILTFNLTDIDLLEQNKDLIMQYKKKYSKEEMQKIYENFYKYNKILLNPECDKINNEFLFEHIEEVEFILKLPNNLKNALIGKANESSFEEYLNVKGKAERVASYNSEIIDFLIHNNFDDNLIFRVNEYFKTHRDYSGLNRRIKEYNDYLIENTKDIYELKDCICYKYYGLNYYETKGQIAFIKKNNIVTNANIENTIKLIEIIDSLNDIESIKSKIGEFNISGTEVQKFLTEIKFVENMYAKTLYNPENDNSQTMPIEYNGKKVKYIQSDIVDFNMLVSRISYAKGIGRDRCFNTERIGMILNDPSVFTDDSIGSDILSTSYISEVNLDTFCSGATTRGKDVILGFDLSAESRIITTKSKDAGTNMEGKGYDFSKRGFLNYYLMLPEELKKDIRLLEGLPVYNEVALSRYENGKKKKPKFLVVIKNAGKYSVPLNESTLKFATYYDIPIVEIDGNKIFLAKSNQLKEKISSIKQKGFITYDDFESIINCMCAMRSTNSGSSFNYIEVLDSMTNFDFDINQINETIKMLDFINTINTSHMFMRDIHDEEYFAKKLEMMNAKKLQLENSKTVDNPEVLGNDESGKHI